MDTSRYLLDIGVGVGMLHNAIRITELMTQFGHEISPKLQEPIGTYGAASVEYGLPALAAVSGLALAGLAVVATNKYLKGSENK